MHDFADTVAALRELHEGHVCVALDNFCGQLTVPQLHSLRPDTVKLDRSFLTQLGSDFESAKAIRSITGMIRPLGVSVVAKGVNSREQLAAVVSLNCDAAQGQSPATRPGERSGLQGVRLRPEPWPIKTLAMRIDRAGRRRNGESFTGRVVGLGAVVRPMRPPRPARSRGCVDPAGGPARTARNSTRACTFRRSSFTCSSQARTWSSGQSTVRSRRPATAVADRGASAIGGAAGRGSATAGTAGARERRGGPERGIGRERGIGGRTGLLGAPDLGLEGGDDLVLGSLLRFGELGRDLLHVDGLPSHPASPGPHPGKADRRCAHGTAFDHHAHRIHRDPIGRWKQGLRSCAGPAE